MPSILSRAEIDDIALDIEDIIGDDEISTDIVYRQTGTTVSTWNPTSGALPSMYTESSVSAFKGGYTLDERETSGGLIEFGDVKFIIGASKVSGVFSVDDQIRESSSDYQSSTTYTVKSIEKDPLNIAYFLQVRAV